MGSLKYEYMGAVLALLAGHTPAIDALSRAAPGVLATIEDYMWVKASLVSPAASVERPLPGTPPGSAALSSGERREAIFAKQTSAYTCSFATDWAWDVPKCTVSAAGHGFRLPYNNSHANVPYT